MNDDIKEIGIAGQQTPHEDTISIPLDQPKNEILVVQETPKAASNTRRTSRFASKVQIILN